MSRIPIPAALASVLALILAGVPAYGQGQPAGRVDPTKKVVEFGTKAVVARTAAAEAALAKAADNPAVMPGKVRWHATFEDACRAAQGSGRPVLLFQMLGKLDQQFC